MHANVPKIAAHTGCGQAPDNTVASFEEGIASGAAIVEVDIRLTKDRVAVLLHDDSPLLQQYSYEELNQLEQRVQLHPSYQDYELARLEDVLRLTGGDGVQLNLDMKSQDAIDPALQLVLSLGMADRVFVTGCSEGTAKRYESIRVLYNAPITVDFSAESSYTQYARTVCQTALELGYYGLNLNASTCRQELVELAHASGLVVWVYTVNEAAAMEKLVRMGVDAITTREVQTLAGVLQLAGERIS
ncbi:glycerophosphodiester phosphodiesterase [Paenibacillus filicis]|uniref:Glycerophosphodiester phosphodiesterase n=1 Tax=Paenibacillus filicis TaxID=669464 RepID=A0ABU9DC47_9BACL